MPEVNSDVETSKPDRQTKTQSCSVSRDIGSYNNTQKYKKHRVPLIPNYPSNFVWTASQLLLDN